MTSYQRISRDALRPGRPVRSETENLLVQNQKALFERPQITKIGPPQWHPFQWPSPYMASWTYTHGNIKVGLWPQDGFLIPKGRMDLEFRLMVIGTHLIDSLRCSTWQELQDQRVSIPYSLTLHYEAPGTGGVQQEVLSLPITGYPTDPGGISRFLVQANTHYFLDGTSSFNEHSYEYTYKEGMLYPEDEALITYVTIPLRNLEIPSHGTFQFRIDANILASPTFYGTAPQPTRLLNRLRLYLVGGTVIMKPRLEHV